MDGVYEATALAMRFWFLIAAIIVLLGVTGISIKEYREKRFVLEVAQNTIGYLTIVSGPEDILNENLQLMRENTIGRSRKVDIIATGLKYQQSAFTNISRRRRSGIR